MSFHHKYLAKKSFHPLNKANQDAVQFAEAQAATLTRRVDERRKLLDRERAIERHQLMITEGRGGIKGQETSVGFMYAPPPGFVPELAPPTVHNAPAVAMRTQMPTSGGGVKEELMEIHDLTREAPSVQPSSAATVSAAASLPLNAAPTLESHEDRRARHRLMTAQQIREELHPALRGAPVAAEHVRASGAFTAKPLGVVLRDTRCVRCGGVGHASLDRECPLFNEAPATDASRRVREDPMTKLKAIAAEQQDQKQQNGTSSSGTATTTAFHVGTSPTGASATGAAAAASSGAKGSFKLVYNDEKYTVGGLADDDPLQQVLLVDSEEEERERGDHRPRRHRTKRMKGEPASSSATAAAAAAAASSLAGDVVAAAAASPSSSTALDAREQAFLAGLSEPDMKLLLRQLLREKRKKAKKEKNDSSSDASSSSSGGSESSDDDKRKARRKKKVRSSSKRGAKKKTSRDRDTSSHSRKKRKDEKERKRSKRKRPASSLSSSSSSDSSHDDRRRRRRSPPRPVAQPLAPPSQQQPLAPTPSMSGPPAADTQLLQQQQQQQQQQQPPMEEDDLPALER